jgi:large subunit ribosomal protein L4
MSTQGTTMIDVPVYSTEGAETGRLEVDPAWFGGEVNLEILRLAVRRHEAARRVGTATTKSRNEVAGSGRKLFRQKGTGRARVGPRRNPIRRGGGHTFAKRPRDFSVKMSKKMRRRALDSALLTRLRDGELLVLDGLELSEPKTRTVAAALQGCGIDRSCLLVLPEHDEVLYKSARNLPRVRVRPVAELNAYEVLWPNRVVFLRPAFDALLEARGG